MYKILDKSCYLLKKTIALLLRNSKAKNSKHKNKRQASNNSVINGKELPQILQITWVLFGLYRED